MQSMASISCHQKTFLLSCRRALTLLTLLCGERNKKRNQINNCPYTLPIWVSVVSSPSLISMYFGCSHSAICELNNPGEILTFRMGACPCITGFFILLWMKISQWLKKLLCSSLDPLSWITVDKDYDFYYRLHLLWREEFVQTFLL